VASCFDNAACESFFATLKTELVHTRAWPTRQAARTAIYDYIEVLFGYAGDLEGSLVGM
jgi:transposase InsO family protein